MKKIKCHNCGTELEYNADNEYYCPECQEYHRYTEFEPISVENATKKMEELIDNSDIEKRHILADRLLCDTLLSLGHKDLVEAYWRFNKWWS